MDLKAPISFSEQIEKLKKHHMVISNEVEAEKILSEINYYRFSGYVLQYRKNSNSSEFVEDISFDTAYRIYCFDKELRGILRKYIENIEVYYRTQISYHFSMIKCKNPPHDQHYDEDNFYNKIGYNEVMRDFEKQKAYYTDSLIMKHHHKKYGDKVPLWVMTEMLSFSDLSKLYKSMYISEKQAVANSVSVSVPIVENNLHCLSVLRNKCAHAARLYNVDLRPSVKFTKVFLRKHPEIKNSSLYAYIIMLVMRLPNTADKVDCVNEIIKAIKTYEDAIDITLMEFPTEWDKILMSYIK